MRSLVLALLCVGSLLAAPVPEEVTAPKGPAPTFLTVTSVNLDTNSLNVTSTVFVTVTEVVTEQVNIGGQLVTRSKAVPKQVAQQRQTVYALAQYDIVTGEGKTLSVETAGPLLKGTAVLLHCDGPLDPAYARLLSKDALILVKKK